MKRRCATILTFTIALILASGLAYAAKKKDQGRSADRTTDPTRDEETLTAELLESARNSEDRLSGTEDDSMREIAQATTYERIKGVTIARQPKK